MMAFANNYVVSLLVNDKPQREFNSNGKRTIQLPFDTEFKVRLKNHTNLRALVNVSIDGASVFFGGKNLILEPKQSIDLERFVGDLDSGRKFKFVRQDKLGDGGHFDPTTAELGKLSVEFVPEWKSVLGTLINTQPYEPYLTTGPMWQINQPHNVFYSSSAHGVIGTVGNSGDKGIVASNSCSEIAFNASMQQCSLESPKVNTSIGGTVEGQVSDQKFTESNGGYIWDWYKKTTIDIQMVGPSPKKELTKAETLAKQFYNEFGGNYDSAPHEIQKALAFVVEKTILHTVLNK